MVLLFEQELDLGSKLSYLDNRDVILLMSDNLADNLKWK